MRSSVAAAQRLRAVGLVTRLVLAVLVPIALYFVSVVLNGLAHADERAAALEPWVAQHPEMASVVATYIGGLRSFAWKLIGLCALCIGVSGSLAARWARQLAGQLLELQRAAQRMARGDLDTPVALGGAGEIDSLVRSLERMREGLKRRIELQAEAEALSRDRDVAEATRALFLPPAERHEVGRLVVTGDRVAPEVGARSFWQYATLQDGGVVVLAGASTQGGTSAAMVAAVSAACLRVLARDPADQVAVTRLLEDIHRTLGRAHGSEGELRLDLLHVRSDGQGAELFSAGGYGLQVTSADTDATLSGGGAPLGGPRFDVLRAPVQLPDKGTFRLALGSSGPTPSDDEQEDRCVVTVEVAREARAA